MIDFTKKASTLGVAAATARPVELPDSDRSIDLRSLQSGKIKVRDENRIQIGRQELRVDAVEQIVSVDQAWSIAQAIRWIQNHFPEPTTLCAALDALEAEIESKGIEVLCPWDTPCGDVVHVRRHEVAAATFLYGCEYV